MKIKIRLPLFYSKRDEAFLFLGFKEIRAIEAVQGVGADLIINLNVRRLNRENLREFIAILRRYGISRKPLKVIAELKKFSWLRRNGWQEIMSDRSE